MPSAPTVRRRYRVVWGDDAFSNDAATDITTYVISEQGIGYGARPSAQSVAPSFVPIAGRFSMFERGVPTPWLTPAGNSFESVSGDTIFGQRGGAENYATPSALRVEANIRPTWTEPPQLLVPFDDAQDYHAGAPFETPAGNSMETHAQNAMRPIEGQGQPWYVELEAVIESTKRTRRRREFTVRDRRSYAYDTNATFIRSPQAHDPNVNIGGEIAELVRQIGTQQASTARGVPGQPVVDPMLRGWIIHYGSRRSVLEKLAQFAIGVPMMTHRGDLAWVHRRLGTTTIANTIRRTGTANTETAYTPQFHLIDERDIGGSRGLYGGLGVDEFEIVDDGMGVDNQVLVGANEGSIPTADATNTLGTVSVTFDSPASFDTRIELEEAARTTLRQQQGPGGSAQQFWIRPQIRRLEEYYRAYGRRMVGSTARNSLPGSIADEALPASLRTSANPLRDLPTSESARRVQQPPPLRNSAEIIVPADFLYSRDVTITGTVFSYNDQILTPANRVDASLQPFTRANLLPGGNPGTLEGLVGVSYTTYEDDPTLPSNWLRLTVIFTQRGTLWGIANRGGLDVGTNAENVTAVVRITPKGGAGTIPKTVTGRGTPYPFVVADPAMPAGGSREQVALDAYASQAQYGILPLQPQDWLNPNTALEDRQVMLEAALTRKRVITGKVWMLGDTEEREAEQPTRDQFGFISDTPEQLAAKAEAREVRARNTLAQAIALQPGMCVNVRSDTRGIPEDTPFIVDYVERHVRANDGAPFKRVVLHER